MTSPTLRELVHTPQVVIEIPPDTGVREAWRLMRYYNIHHLVVRSGDDIIGVVADRDIFERGMSRDQFSQPVLSEWRTVRDVMTPIEGGVSEQSTAVDALERMSRLRCSALPIVRTSGIVGIVTESDLLKQLPITMHEDN